MLGKGVEVIKSQVELAAEFAEVHVELPDIPGAISEGQGEAAAIVGGQTALGLVLFDEEDLPKASSLAAIQKANPGKKVVLIAVELSEAAKKAKHIGA